MRSWLRLTVLGLVASGVAVAAPMKPAELPASLKDWSAWVLHGQEHQLCPVGLDQSRICTWPGRLQLSLDDKGGRFSQSFRVYAQGFVPLPGDDKRWPQNVKADGKDAVVTTRVGRPTVELTAGDHVITGDFLWDSMPESINIPHATGLLSLTVKGKEVQFPNRDESGQVFLQKEATTQAETENVDLQVHRMVVDEIPLQLTTHLRLNVSGKSRELTLGRALPPGFVPMSLTSGLPARLEPDGRLKLQARAGSWTIELVARHEGVVTALSRPKSDGLWTESDEVWVFDARQNLRQVLVEGVSAVDPQQTTLPDQWKRLPAYAVGPADTMKLSERRRGDSDPAPDVLKLHRTMWLDFDGAGYTMNDRMTGTLHRSWRLEMQAPTELGRAVASGADQFITRLGDGTQPGVELRQGIFTMEADSRITGDRSNIPAVSWDADFHQVSSTLNLPPGWRLFHAGGADDVPSTWVRQWSLLEIFLVLIVAVALWKLFGLLWGVLALIAFTLLFPEADAPQWVWLFVLAGEALVRVLQKGPFLNVAKVYRLGAWLVLILISVSFVVEHVRHGMYPALEHSYKKLGGVQTFDAYEATNAATYLRSQQNDWAPSSVGSNSYDGYDQKEDIAEADGFGNALGGLGSRGAMANRVAPAPQQMMKGGGKMRSFNVQDYDKNAMVQTGPGLPRWEWNEIQIGFSGPVERDQRLHLYLMSPQLNLVLTFLRVLLLCALLLCVLNFPGSFWPQALRRRESPKAPTPPSPPQGATRAAVPAAAALLVLATWSVPTTAHAQSGAVPPPEMLEQLRQRLLERPECEPQCASSPRLMIEGDSKTLRLRMEIHAAAETVVPLPGNAQHWNPSTVVLDGKPAAGLMRDMAGTLWLVVTKGSHQVVLEGTMPPRETVQLPLPMKSHLVQAKVDGFRIDGIHEDGLADENVQLTRNTGGEQAEAEALQTGNLPPFVRVQRELTLGLQWTVETRVQRLTPVGSAVVLEVPLLAGESVTTQDLRVQGGKALVNMGPQATEVAWSSVLSEKSPITLKAPTGVSWVESWKLDVSPVWHVEMSGIPVVHQQDASGARLPEWRPWPGETVTIEVTRPQGVTGQTLTIDQSQLRVTPGLRATDATLTANLRSSRGGLHTFTLPQGAQLQTVNINNRTQPIRQEGDKVSIPLVPGSQTVQLTWRQPEGIGTTWRSPKLDMGTRTVNASLEVVVPQDRWVLLLSGPRMGPAVLFWSLLFALVLVAVALGRLTLTPLGTGQWVLLTLGLSQVPVPAAAVVVGWLLAIGWRKNHVEFGKHVAWFNLRQFALFGWALVAMGVLFASIYEGLLGTPDMQIKGNGSYANQLHWFQDRTSDLFPQGWVLSVPMLVYRGAMLAWSLWLAFALIKWLKWAWLSFNEGGLWRRAPKAAPPPPSSATPPPATAS